MSYSRSTSHGVAIWVGKPWVTPIAIFRTLGIVIVAILFLLVENYFGIAIAYVVGMPLYLWTLLAFAIIWLVAMIGLLIFWASNSYVLRQDGLEIRRGIVRLHSFVVTPAGFGDLMVDQSLGGRIFGYGDLTVNSQGERETRLRLVRSPFNRADIIRDIMGKPIVRFEERA
ncbi:MAG: hypothetical protein NWE98_00440 [Candidatus Bathyarchaeota archaeon]|nr:hypothetical protein [Candidatus Bathyarchaeota archaeon]